MSLNELKKRIDSTSKTAQITKAMQMVSASKYNRMVENSKRYFVYSNRIKQMVAHIGKQQFDLLDNGTPINDDIVNYVDFHDMLLTRPVKKIGYLIITSDKGLAGSYNSSVLKSVERMFEQDHKDSSEVVVLAIGEPIVKFCKENNYEVVHELHHLPDNPSFTDVQKLVRTAVELFKKQVFDALYVCYNHHLGPLSFQFRADQILPVSELEIADAVEEADTNIDYLIEPDETAVLDLLLPQYAESQIYGAIIDAKTTEHASRMNAMRSATDNAFEMIDNLQQKYHQERQVKVTNEILEIINGANALEDNKEGNK